MIFLIPKALQLEVSVISKSTDLKTNRVRTNFINGGTRYHPFVFMLIRPTDLTLVGIFFWIVPMAARLIRLIRLISIKSKRILNFTAIMKEVYKVNLMTVLCCRSPIFSFIHLGQVARIDWGTSSVTRKEYWTTRCHQRTGKMQENCWQVRNKLFLYDSFTGSICLIKGSNCPFSNST